MKKRIIISSYDDLKNPFYGGGGAHVIHEIAKRLSQKYSLTVITSSYPGSKSRAVIDGVRYKRVGLWDSHPKLGQIGFSILLPFVAAKESYKVWVESVTPPFSSSLLPLFSKGKVISLIHMLAAEDMKRKYKLPFHIIQNLGLSLYRRFIVMSEINKEKILAVNPKADVSVIPNGISMPKNSRINANKHILFIGRIEWNQKGLDLLLLSYSKAKLSKPLVIAGSGTENEMKKLKDTIKSLKLEKKVRLVGRVENTEKETLFREALCVVMSSRFETFPVVALEAMSYKKPLICFDIDGTKWIPEDAALKVPAYDVGKLVTALKRFSTNSKSRNDYAAKGSKFVKKFSWDSIVKKYIEVIEGSL